METINGYTVIAEREKRTGRNVLGHRYIECCGLHEYVIGHVVSVDGKSWAWGNYMTNLSHAVERFYS